MDKLLDLTRDFDAAKAAFEAYLDEYDRADDKIHLKIVHTYGVVDAAEDIARRMGLGEEDVQLAKVIGLLHDIGRFEQIKRFDSFEPGTMEHAAYGAQILFGPEKMIRRFVKDDRFDSLICTAIEKHSIYIKYPGSSSFKKVKTTTSNFFTLTRMKKNTKYGIKVIANKKVKNKVWHSDSKAYNMSLV